jgi:hypothetical protein
MALLLGVPAGGCTVLALPAAAERRGRATTVRSHREAAGGGAGHGGWCCRSRRIALAAGEARRCAPCAPNGTSQRDSGRQALAARHDAPRGPPGFGSGNAITPSGCIWASRAVYMTGTEEMPRNLLPAWSAQMLGTAASRGHARRAWVISPKNRGLCPVASAGLGSAAIERATNHGAPRRCLGREGTERRHGTFGRGGAYLAAAAARDAEPAKALYSQASNSPPTPPSTKA